MAPNELKSTGGVKVSPLFARIYTRQITTLLLTTQSFTFSE